MSLIAKMLAAECLDPCGEVCFVVVLRCHSQADLDQCQAVFIPLAGEIHVEDDAGGFRFLFINEIGADADACLLLLNTLLDDENGIELIETKNVNLRGTNQANHSFVFQQEGEPGASTIILSPSHAFGSGDHPSTGLAIEFLEERSPLAADVLDVGCGTGVLSFVAQRLGAEHVLGIDIDPEGIRGAVANAKLNHLDHACYFSDQKLADITESFPLILANLTYSVLQYLLGDVTSLAAQDGVLIVSGLQGRQGADAEEFLSGFGWQVKQRKSAGKWQALLAVKV